jgi:hypothetical protein
LTYEDFSRATAIINHAVIKMSVEKTFPNASNKEQDDMILLVIERMARMRGYAIRREVFEGADESD